MLERQFRFISSDEELDKWCYIQTSFYCAGFTVGNLDLTSGSRICYIILCVQISAGALFHFHKMPVSHPFTFFSIIRTERLNRHSRKLFFFFNATVY